MHRTIPRLLALLTGLLLATARAAVVAHHPFDSGFDDASGNGRHGTLVDGGVAGNSGVTTAAGDWRFGGGALHLAPERDYVSVPSRTFSSGSPYTIAFWARKSPGDTGGAAQWDMVIGTIDTTTFFIGLNNGTGLRWRGADATAQRQADFTVPNDTSWHHIAVTATSAGTLSAYLDGALVSAATNKLTGFIYDTIGEAYTAASDFDFNGQIDELWVFDEALSAPEIANLAQFNSRSAPGSVPLLHYRLDGDYTDASGGSNTGIPAGGAVLESDPAAVPVGAGALRLDGADASQVRLSTAVSLLSSQPWTVAFWARRGETGGSKGMVMGERNTTDDFIWLNDAFTGLRFRSSTNQTLDFTAPKDQALHHYALVADGAGNLRLHLDGVPGQTLSGNTSLRVDTVGQGYTTNTLHYAFQGVLDDVRIVAGALTAAEVLALYELGDPPGPVEVDSLRVFLVGGQSNADGRGEVGSLPTAPVNLQQPQPDIDFAYRAAGGSPTLTTLRPGTSATGQFGPEVTLGPGLTGWLGADASNRIAIVKYAIGGTSLSTDWKAGGDATTAGDGPQYVIFQETVAAGLAALGAAHPSAAISLEGMVWMQGESDAAAAGAYAENLAAFIADVRATLGAGLPFVVGRLSSGQTAIGAAPLATLRAAQVAVADADPLTGWIDTDAYPVKPDALHFTGEGQQALGAGFARGLAYLAWVRGNFTPAQRAAGAAEPAADPDADGADNEGEFIALTSPTSAASRLEGALGTDAGQLVLGHDSSAGVRYFVEFRPGPAAGWTEVLPALPGTGSAMERALPDPGGRSGQYRVGAIRP